MTKRIGSPLGDELQPSLKRQRVVIPHLTTAYFISVLYRYRTPPTGDIIVRGRKILDEFSCAEYCAPAIEFFMKKLIRVSFQRANSMKHACLLNKDISYAQASDCDLSTAINIKSVCECLTYHRDQVMQHRELILHFVRENVTRRSYCVYLHPNQLIRFCAILDSFIRDCAKCEMPIDTSSANKDLFSNACAEELTNYVCARIKAGGI